MFPSAGAATSPRRQSVTYPGYQAQYADYPPAHGGYGGHGPGEAAMIRGLMRAPACSI